MNGFLVILMCGICFILGFAYSMSYWYERAEKNIPITIRGKVYKLVEQNVIPKETGNAKIRVSYPISCRYHQSH